MKTCTKILMSAVMSISVGSAAWAQSSTGGTGDNSIGSASGSQNETGGSGPASISGGATGTDATGTDAMGSQTNDTSRSMQGGADAELSQQLDKIASMPDKAPDALFALDAAKQNMFEVAFAQLAQQKSQDPKIKDMAKMVEQDHSQANEKLKQVIQKMGLTAPSSLPSSKQKMLTVYQAMNSQDFDTCFILENKASHAKSITSYTDHQKSVKDEDLRQYVTAVLPKLQQHGMMVQQAASEKGFSSPMGGGGAKGADHGSHGSHNHGSMDNSTSTDLTTGSGAGSTGASSTGAGSTGSSSMDASGSTGSTGAGSGTGITTGGSGANSDPTAPANNQNPSNR